MVLNYNRSESICEILMLFRFANFNFRFVKKYSNTAHSIINRI